MMNNNSKIDDVESLVPPTGKIDHHERTTTSTTSLSSDKNKNEQEEEPHRIKKMIVDYEEKIIMSTNPVASSSHQPVPPSSIFRQSGRLRRRQYSRKEEEEEEGSASTGKALSVHSEHIRSTTTKAIPMPSPASLKEGISLTHNSFGGRGGKQQTPKSLLDDFLSDEEQQQQQEGSYLPRHDLKQAPHRSDASLGLAFARRKSNKSLVVSDNDDDDDDDESSKQPSYSYDAHPSDEESNVTAQRASLGTDPLAITTTSIMDMPVPAALVSPAVTRNPTTELPSYISLSRTSSHQAEASSALTFSTTASQNNTNNNVAIPKIVVSPNTMIPTTPMTMDYDNWEETDDDDNNNNDDENNNNRESSFMPMSLLQDLGTGHKQQQKQQEETRSRRGRQRDVFRHQQEKTLNLPSMSPAVSDRRRTSDDQSIESDTSSLGVRSAAFINNVMGSFDCLGLGGANEQVYSDHDDDDFDRVRLMPQVLVDALPHQVANRRREESPQSKQEKYNKKQPAAPYKSGTVSLGDNDDEGSKKSFRSIQTDGFRQQRYYGGADFVPFSNDDILGTSGMESDSDHDNEAVPRQVQSSPRKQKQSPKHNSDTVSLHDDDDWSFAYSMTSSPSTITDVARRRSSQGATTNSFRPTSSLTTSWHRPQNQEIHNDTAEMGDYLGNFMASGMTTQKLVNVLPNELQQEKKKHRDRKQRKKKRMPAHLSGSVSLYGGDDRSLRSGFSSRTDNKRSRSVHSGRHSPSSLLWGTNLAFDSTEEFETLSKSAAMVEPRHDVAAHLVDATPNVYRAKSKGGRKQKGTRKNLSTHMSGSVSLYADDRSFYSMQSSPSTRTDRFRYGHLTNPVVVEQQYRHQEEEDEYIAAYRHQKEKKIRASSVPPEAKISKGSKSMNSKKRKKRTRKRNAAGLSDCISLYSAKTESSKSSHQYSVKSEILRSGAKNDSIPSSIIALQTNLLLDMGVDAEQLESMDQLLSGVPYNDFQQADLSSPPPAPPSADSASFKSTGKSSAGILSSGEGTSMAIASTVPKNKKKMGNNSNSTIDESSEFSYSFPDSDSSSSASGDDAMPIPVKLGKRERARLANMALASSRGNDDNDDVVATTTTTTTSPTPPPSHHHHPREEMMGQVRNQPSTETLAQEVEALEHQLRRKLQQQAALSALALEIKARELDLQRKLEQKAKAAAFAADFRRGEDERIKENAKAMSLAAEVQIMENALEQKIEEKAKLLRAREEFEDYCHEFGFDSNSAQRHNEEEEEGSQPSDEFVMSRRDEGSSSRRTSLSKQTAKSTMSKSTPVVHYAPNTTTTTSTMSHRYTRVPPEEPFRREVREPVQDEEEEDDDESSSRSSVNKTDSVGQPAGCCDCLLLLWSP